MILIEVELSKFDMLALQNATVCLDKLECFKRVTTRKKVCRSRHLENGSNMFKDISVSNENKFYLEFSDST